MSYYDEDCPHCGKGIDMGSIWPDCDYLKEFSFECPHCEKAVSAEVEFDPIFSLSEHRCADCKKVMLKDEHCCDECLAARKKAAKP